MKLYIQHIDTPVGKMKVGATDQGIVLFDFEYRRMIDAIMKRIFKGLGSEEYVEKTHPHIETLKQEIQEYFDGARKEFSVPLYLIGTDFQKRVWQGLLNIPYGDTRSYEQQSLFLGDAKAIRAVAGANGENGIAIIIPCHRVIGKNGSLTGYGGGLPKKKWLLEHEFKYSGKSTQAQLF